MSKSYCKNYDMVSGKAMSCGKHRNKDCKWIAYNDPTYIIWAKTKTEWRICSKLLEASRKRAEELKNG